MGFESFTPKPVVETASAARSEVSDEYFTGTDEGFLPESPALPVLDAAVNETFADPEELSMYHERNAELQGKLTSIDSTIESTFGVAESEMALSDELDSESLLNQREALLVEKVAAEANYPGDWTGLLYERMKHEETRRKFIERRSTAMSAMLVGEPGMMDKPKQFAAHYQEQIDQYDERIEDIFKITNIGPAAAYGKQPVHLGEGNINEPGTVFSDTALTIRQKNMIEAHEKGHGLRNFESPTDSAEIRAVIDVEELDRIAAEHSQTEQKRFPKNYLQKPEEIVERMAQFKNYFGMKGGEEFTKRHLDHVRTHYVSDTRLDNGVSTLLACVSPRTEATFLRVINEYPV